VGSVRNTIKEVLRWFHVRINRKILISAPAVMIVLGAASAASVWLITKARGRSLDAPFLRRVRPLGIGLSVIYAKIAEFRLFMFHL